MRVYIFLRRQKYLITRMHSSRMRTGRPLTVFWGLLFPGGRGGVYLPSPGGCTCLVLGGRGGTWSGGCTWSRGVYLPAYRLTIDRILGSAVFGGGGVCTCLVLGGYTWSGGVPGPGGCTCLVLGGVPACSRGVGGVPAWSRGVYLPGPGVYLPGPRGGVPAWSWGGCLVRYSPPVNRITDRCKNITLAKTSFRPVKTAGTLKGDLRMRIFPD